MAVTKIDEDSLTLVVSKEDWTALLMILGGALYHLDADLKPGLLALVNRLNEGNPNFLPYTTQGRS